MFSLLQNQTRTKPPLFHLIFARILKPPNVKFGQKWEIAEDEVTDWMYMKSDMIHGGFTIEPLLDSYPKEQADAIRSKLVR